MTLPSTPICFLLAVVAGFGVYRVKQESQHLDRGIAQTVAAVEQERAKIVRLQAQWAVLNEGERLAGLAQRHLPTLAPVRLEQVAAVTELEQRLPPPVAPAAVAAPIRAVAAGGAGVPAIPWPQLFVGR